MTVEWRTEPKSVAPAPGAILLSCFPGAGLAATVAGHYVVQSLHLPRIGTLTSPDLPPVAVIQGGSVQPPIRAYGGAELAVVLTEFPPPIGLIPELARALLATAAKLQVRMIVGLEGVMPHPLADGDDDDAEESAEPAEENVWYAGSGGGESLPPEYKAAGVRSLADGVITGVSGSLLIESLGGPIPVATLLVSARDAGYPDHRAAAKMIEVLDQALPHLKIDTRPLRTQAELIERAVRAATKAQRASSESPPGAPEPTIYQ